MPSIDLSFPVQGASLQVDHGYSLFAAVAEKIPPVHPSNRQAAQPHQQSPADLWNLFAIHPIAGRISGYRQLLLTASSRLTLRLDASLIPDVIGLAGSELRIGPDRVRVGVPQVFGLTPAPTLFARLVTIKGYMVAEAFCEAAQAQLAKLSVGGTVRLVPQATNRLVATGSVLSSPEPTEVEHTPTRFIRRTIRIRNAEVVGFAVIVDGLSASDSLRLQEHGLGGRRRMGCGVFVPARTRLLLQPRSDQEKPQ